MLLVFVFVVVVVGVVVELAVVVFSVDEFIDEDMDCERLDERPLLAVVCVVLLLLLLLPIKVVLLYSAFMVMIKLSDRQRC